jgi:hypothetical protein
MGKEKEIIDLNFRGMLLALTKLFCSLELETD